MKSLPLLAFALLSATPVFASVTVSSPANGATVAPTFSLVASASPCSSQNISSIGYSIDASTTTVAVKGASLSTSVTSTAGSHVLHVKSWGAQGAVCKTDVNVNVNQNTTNLAVSAPGSGTTVNSPFALSASATLCSGQSVTKMGYSLDTGTTETVSGTSLSANVLSTGGSHTLHVTSWGSGGTSCKTDVALNVKGPVIPSTATATNLIQNLSTWSAKHDTATHGTSTGAMSLVGTPSWTGSARKFVTAYTDYGGERYSVSLPANQAATSFVYDTMIYIANPSTDVSNIEMDINQVIPNGDTVIYGFQCDNWSHTWDYTANAGTPAKPLAHWLHSNQSCYPQKWTTNTWHHVQIQYSRDSSGNVSYKSVWLDSVKQDLNVTVLSAFTLGWDAKISSNFQVGGANSSSGTSTIYLDSLTIYAW